MIANERPRRRELWLRGIERLLVLTAALSFGWYAAVHTAAALDQATWTRQLEQIRASHTAAGTAGTSGSVRTHRAPQSLVGRLELPRLGLSAIVQEGADSSTLRRAIGHIPETALPGEDGNTAFAGHRDTFFRDLKNVRSGDRIVVTTSDGVFQYLVRETRVVPPSDLSVLDPTPEQTLTLVTCYPFDYIGLAPKRFIVHASRAREGTEVTGQHQHGDTETRGPHED